MSITSDEVNYLVFRYLQESGFQHAAFTFGFESMVHRAEINGNDVPPGALVSFIQKGLQYVELEANLNAEGKHESGENTPSDFTLLQPEDLLTKDVGELRRTIQKKKEQRERSQRQRDRDRGDGGGDRQGDKPPKSKKSKTAQASKDRDEKKKSSSGPSPMDTDAGDAGAEAVKTEPGKEGSAAEEKEKLIAEDEVRSLRGHTSEVFIIQWSPKNSLLASGSGDSTARIWDVAGGGEPICLSHVTAGGPAASKEGESPAPADQGNAAGGASKSRDRDVTTLDWSSDGKYLATGSYDGQARVWDASGNLVKTLNGHKGPIFSLKWNEEGKYLLSGSVDKTAIVWDVGLGKDKDAEMSDGGGNKPSGSDAGASRGSILQQYSLHNAPTLDVDWRTNDSFATCSTDTQIYVCKIGATLPVKTFSAHTDEVNAISWDSTGTYLASCSDDCTAKVWTLSEDKPLHSFSDHSREIYMIRWSPKKQGRPLLLASASFDATVRLWEMEKGTCLYQLIRHEDPVYSVAFSPCGDYLATGSFDKNLHIWSVKTGKHLKTHKGESGIFEVCWNKDGNQVAACYSNSTINIVDFRK